MADTPRQCEKKRLELQAAVRAEITAAFAGVEQGQTVRLPMDGALGAWWRGSKAGDGPSVDRALPRTGVVLNLKPLLKAY